MRKRYKSGLLVSALTAAALVVGTQAYASHPAVGLRDAAGALITTSTGVYSPKATCGACHDQSTAEIDAAGTKGGGPVGSYDGGGVTKQVVKTQGVLNETTGEVEWVSFNVTAYEHGFVAGRHSQQGRNEDYGNHLRHAVHGKFWAESPGMFGKY